MSNTRNRWLGLVFISMAISLVIIDGTIVNTIFPSITKSLTLSDTQIQWVQESYVLVFASLLLVWGSLADRFGRRLLLIVGIAVFVAASIWAGMATTADALILARIVQGLGGAMVLPTTLSLVNANFVGKERGIAFAVWGATIGGMVAVGPVLGGWLTTVDWKLDLSVVLIESWRWAFWVNLPLGILVIAGLIFFVGESRQEQREGGIDFVGALLSALGFFTLTFGLIEGRFYGWWDQKNPFNLFGVYDWPTESISIIPVSLFLSIVFFVIFVMWERSREAAHKNVILDLNLFHIKSFRNGSIAALIISMGEFGLIFAIPLWLQNIEGLDALHSGIVLLWLAGGAFVASGLVGGLSGKLSPVWAVRIGVILEVIGIAGLGFFVSVEGNWQSIATWLFIYGFGVGVATAQLTGVIMQDVPFEKIGQGSGTQSTARQIGSALGIAVLGTLLFTGLTSNVSSNIQSMKELEGIDAAQVKMLADNIGDLTEQSAGAVVPQLSALLQSTGAPTEFSDAIAVQAREGFTQSVRTTAYAAAGFLALGLVATFTIKARRPEENEPELYITEPVDEKA
jgi:EmrB/QacA subfamily drug resistance transporter